MGKVTKIVMLVVILLVVAMYGTFYYVYQNLTWNFSGFDFTQEALTGNTSGMASEMASIVDKIRVSLAINNGSSVPLKITKIKLSVKDMDGKLVGAIVPIRSIKIPANGSNILDIDIENINEMAILSDLLAGKVAGYKYTVSGFLGGMLPIRYTDSVIS